MGDEADFLKVLDFGIAKIEGAEEDATVTRAGWVHGTPAYMSPEVCNGARADARSDVYSLGAVLYFLLTGTPPVHGATTAAAVMVAHVSEQPDQPSQRVPVPRRPRAGRHARAREEARGALPERAGPGIALSACRDASGWTRAQAAAFWTTFEQKPRAAVTTRPANDEEAATLEALGLGRDESGLKGAVSVQLSAIS